LAKNNAGTIIVEAKPGGNASGVTAGAGGTGGTGSAANFNGGAVKVGRPPQVLGDPAAAAAAPQVQWAQVK